ncbi:UNKNOWN [Stylonychia lemnae]|uniref:Uncharacterized protein n=1 Tax=Stylonychia lemnae TaxID=5949 RepID=A0A078AA61_STYLE|nr:UNKNOWN [Stylonychia lemnae]|eukprot:CDW78442.1 UNKNOWN [Stylonychia lemnae]
MKTDPKLMMQLIDDQDKQEKPQKHSMAEAYEKRMLKIIQRQELQIKQGSKFSMYDKQPQKFIAASFNNSILNGQASALSKRAKSQSKNKHFNSQATTNYLSEHKFSMFQHQSVFDNFHNETFVFNSNNVTTQNQVSQLDIRIKDIKQNSKEYDNRRAQTQLSMISQDYLNQEPVIATQNQSSLSKLLMKSNTRNTFQDKYDKSNYVSSKILPIVDNNYQEDNYQQTQTKIFGRNNMMLLNQKNSIQDLISQKGERDLLKSVIKKVSGGQNVYSGFIDDYNIGSQRDSKFKRYLTSSLKKQNLSKSSLSSYKVQNQSESGVNNLEKQHYLDTNMLLNINQDKINIDKQFEDDDDHHIVNNLDESEFLEDMKEFENDKELEFPTMYKYGLRLEWSHCYLYKKCQKERSEFNMHKNHKLFQQSEVLAAIQIIQERQRDFKDFLLLEPYFLKSVNTLRELIFKELEFNGLYVRYIKRYGLVTLKNTQKLLLLCKRFFELRLHFIEVFSSLARKKVQYRAFKMKIKAAGKQIEQTDDEDEILDLGTETVKNCTNALLNIQQIRKKSKLFNSEFIFEDEDQVKLLRRECNEVRQILFVFGIEIQCEDSPPQILEQKP